MNHRHILTLILTVIIITVSSFTSDELRVTLSNGSKLIGRYLRSHSGRSIKAFTAIPYAKPPTGQLRFNAPQPIDKWDGEYIAIEDGPMCPQRDPFVRSYEDVGVEDCLHLNVYVPHSNEEKTKSNISVLVYSHGGGFVCGSGMRTRFGPDYFLDYDIIFVTYNYRVGPLGFLSTGDENCPGNSGLKDQVLALKWVRDNIKQFGGDPESVTIMGGSAGGASVCYLMASPLAKGLFARAIAHSGTNLAPWSQVAYEGVPQKRAKKLAEHFDCHIPNDWYQTIQCLRNVSARDITAAFYNFFDFDMDPMVAFTPVIEPNLPGAFLTKHPRDVISETSQHIPFLTGINFDEGLMKSAPFFDIPGLFEEFSDNIDNALPIIFYYDHLDPSVQKSITTKIKEFYFEGKLTREKENNVTNLFGDGWFLAAMDEYLRLRLANDTKTTNFVYLLANHLPLSFTSVFNGDPNKYYGVSHADEALYLFPVRERLFSTTLPTKEEDQVRDAMLKMWINFARTGDPTPNSNTEPKWDKVNGFPINYFRIGNMNLKNKPMFGMENGGIFEDRAKFWSEIKTYSTAKHFQKDEL